MPHLIAESEGTRYHFVNNDTGVEFPIQQVRYEGPEIKIGDVIEIHAPDSKPVYFTVSAMTGADFVTVHLVRARNQLWKTLLLLAILAASWFVIAHVLKLIF